MLNGSCARSKRFPGLVDINSGLIDEKVHVHDPGQLEETLSRKSGITEKSFRQRKKNRMRPYCREGRSGLDID